MSCAGDAKRSRAIRYFWMKEISNCIISNFKKFHLKFYNSLFDYKWDLQ